MTYEITRNEQYNSTEVHFDGKPSEMIREVLKSLRFRWHGVRRVWYGYADEATTREAIESANNEQITNARTESQKKATAKKAALSSLWDRCDVSALPAYGTDNEIKNAVREEARTNGGSYDKFVAAYIRKHLRGRFPECKFSVTSGGAGYLNACDIEIKSSPYARDLVKGDPNNIDYRKHWDHYENSAELDAILDYCNALHRAFDADDGDIYADYGARHDLYGGVSVAYGYKQTEATEEQKASAADFAARKAQAEEEQKAKEAAELEAYEKRMEEERKNAEELERIRTAEAAEVVDHVKVQDLADHEQIAVVGLLEGCGKEGRLDEVKANVEWRRTEGKQSRADAIITRKLHFTDKRIFDNFCTMFMRDFDFVAGKGGTETEDVRITSADQLSSLNQEQRKSVKTFLFDCIGIYFCGAFQFVIDPQGYRYSKYVLIPDDDTDSYRAKEKREEWREQSEQLPPLYFPAPLDEQIKAANLEPRDTFTMIHLDEWIGTATTTAGDIVHVTVSDYAQYKNAAHIHFTTTGKRKPQSITIRPGQPCAIWRGILPEVPDNIKYTTIREDGGTVMRQVNFAGEHARTYIIEVIEYYRSLGFIPVVDTIQR